MYDVLPAFATSVSNVDSNDSNVTQSYNAFEFNFNARLPHGGRLFGGSATDRTVANTCAGAATNPNFLVTIGGVNYCDQSNSGMPWRTQFKIAGSIPLPWYGLQAAASFQALPATCLGTQALTAGGAGVPNFTSFSGVGSSFTVTPDTRYTVCPGNSASQGCTVGRAGCPNQITGSFAVPLDAPGTLMTPRVTQLDFSISKRSDRSVRQDRSEARRLQRAELRRLLHRAVDDLHAGHQLVAGDRAQRFGWHVPAAGERDSGPAAANRRRRQLVAGEVKR
jgi:hypothetical protein